MKASYTLPASWAPVILNDCVADIDDNICNAVAKWIFDKQWQSKRRLYCVGVGNEVWLSEFEGQKAKVREYYFITKKVR